MCWGLTKLSKGPLGVKTRPIVVHDWFAHDGYGIQSKICQCVFVIEFMSAFVGLLHVEYSICHTRS